LILRRGAQPHVHWHVHWHDALAPFRRVAYYAAKEAQQPRARPRLSFLTLYDHLRHGVQLPEGRHEPLIRPYRKLAAATTFVRGAVHALRTRRVWALGRRGRRAGHACVRGSV
jgi:hypothetical protein